MSTRTFKETKQIAAVPMRDEPSSLGGAIQLQRKPLKDNEEDEELQRLAAVYRYLIERRKKRLLLLEARTPCCSDQEQKCLPES
jgi:hypothetical protein